MVLVFFIIPSYALKFLYLDILNLKAGWGEWQEFRPSGISVVNNAGGIGTSVLGYNKHIYLQQSWAWYIYTLYWRYNFLMVVARGWTSLSMCEHQVNCQMISRLLINVLDTTLKLGRGDLNMNSHWEVTNGTYHTNKPIRYIANIPVIWRTLALWQLSSRKPLLGQLPLSQQPIRIYTLGQLHLCQLPLRIITAAGQLLLYQPSLSVRHLLLGHAHTPTMITNLQLKIGLQRMLDRL